LLFDGSKIWVANYNDSTIKVLRATNGTPLDTLRTGLVPSGMADDGSHVWVGCQTSNQVFSYDKRNGIVSNIYGVDSPADMVFDGTSIWVANFFDSTVTKISRGLD